MGGNTFHSITGEYEHHTDRALCVTIDAGKYWLPLTTIELDPNDDPLTDYRRGDSIKFKAQEWLLKKNGLDNYVDE